MNFVTFIPYTLTVITCSVNFIHTCKTPSWRNLTFEELMLKSDVVAYGKDVDHGKLRLPTAVDARFDVYCVFKKGPMIVPSQVIIENINKGNNCSGVKGQTVEGQEYIIGLTRELSGFMTYADVNPLQKTAFAPTKANLNKLASTCGLDDWAPPATGNQDRCPTADKPRWCTKIRDPTNHGNSICYRLCFLFCCIILIRF